MKGLGPLTPVHSSLWHHGFVILCVVALMLNAAAYMLSMVHPLLMHHYAAVDDSCRTGLASSGVAYLIGLFLFGPANNWLVQRYPRGRVCRVAVLGFGLCAVATYLMLCHREFFTWHRFALVRMFTGSFFGLASMVLLGTLVVDKTESWLRTLANHTVAWMLRFGMVLGPVAAIVLQRNVGLPRVCLSAFGLIAVAAVLLTCVWFPFKTPEDDVSRLSSDRFLLDGSLLPFVLTCAGFVVYGFVLMAVSSVMCYVLVLLGFLWVLVLERYLVVTSLSMRQLEVSLLFVVAGGASLLSDGALTAGLLGPGLLGAGIGMTAACSQLLLIERSGHCRRGTAVNTSFLACESGVALGLAIAPLLL